VRIASIDGTFRAWVDGGETEQPPTPYPWFVSFPRDAARASVRPGALRLCRHRFPGADMANRTA